VQITIIFGANYLCMSDKTNIEANRIRINKKLTATRVRIAWWAGGSYKDKFLEESHKKGVSESELLYLIVKFYYERKNI
jgi:hypothetical protein